MQYQILGTKVSVWTVHMFMINFPGRFHCLTQCTPLGETFFFGSSHRDEAFLILETSPLIVLPKNTDCSWFSCTGYRSMSLLLVLQVVLRRPKSQKRSSLSLRNVWNFMTPWRLAWQDFCFPFVAFSGRCNCLSTVDSCGRLSVLFDLVPPNHQPPGRVAVQSIYSHRLGLKPSRCLWDQSEWAYSAKLCSVATAENLLSRAVVEFVFYSFDHLLSVHFVLLSMRLSSINSLFLYSHLVRYW